jgi:alpha-tubulin suppressor-like RCC1 family protein
VTVVGLSSGVTAIAAGFYHICALTNVGSVKCWGWNSNGQLGNGATDNRNLPVDVVGLTSGVTSIGAGYGHTCALHNGGIMCWGYNSSGQLGNSTTAEQHLPVNVTGLTSGVVAIGVGGYHTCAIITGGAVKCWGNNGNGRLGDNTASDRSAPVNVIGLTNGVTAIAAEGGHTCAIITGGSVKCWGYNRYGQLGDNTTTDRLTPVDVIGLTSGVRAIAAEGGGHTCALTSAGGVKCWGWNIYGQLGNGTTSDSRIPVNVSGLTSGVTAIAEGNVHSCALTNSADIKCWGFNSNSQLGDGTTATRLLPVNVIGLEGGYSFPVLRVAPASVPANGVATVVVTLTGASAGQQIRFVSSRGNQDTFTNAVGVVNNNGILSTTIGSSNPGTVVIFVEDLTAGQALGTSAQITFTGGSGILPPVTGQVDVVGVTAQHPLDARYLQGIPVANRIDVAVDWKGTTPGHVDFILNGKVYSGPVNAAVVSHNFDMGNDLRSGHNSLRIVAVNAAGQASNPRDFSPYSVPAPVWLTGLHLAGLMSLPVLATGDLSSQATYQMGFHLPNQPFDIEALQFGVPDADTGLEWSIDGQLKIPLDCTSPFEASVTGGVSGFKLMGAEIGVETSGGLQADRVDVCAFELPHGFASLKVDATRNIYRKPVLVMITYFNAVVGTVVDQIVVVLNIQEFVGKLGEFYVDGNVHFDAGTQINLTNQFPYFSFHDLELGGGLGIEGGFRADLNVVEVKVWAGADGSIKFVRMGPVTWPPIDNWKFDSITLIGEVGAKFRVGWFERQATGSLEWKYPATIQEAMKAVARDLAITDWRLIGHSSRKDYAVFLGDNSTHQAFSPANDVIHAQAISAQNAVTSTLVSNVYTYPEPSLAVNLSNNNALIVWTYDDVAKPVGQSHEIEFSRWNGSSWSVPAGVTNDYLLDDAPQVAWANNGNAVAVWQRLNNTLPITATWDVTTATKIEIATSVYSPTVGTWSSLSLLTANTALDMKPQLARSSAGNILVVWRQNDAGLLGGIVGQTDRIAYSFYNASWGVPASAVDNILGLTELAAGNGNSAATIAYTQDLTPTGYPTPTLQLFTSMWNGSNWAAPVQQTDDSLGHRNPQVIYNAVNQPLIVWLAGNELRLKNLNTSSIVTLALDSSSAIDEFRIVQDNNGNIAAVFTAQGIQRNLYVAFYDQSHNVWGKPKQLTDDDASESYPSVGLDSTGRLLMAYASTAITSITKTATISGTGEVVTYTLPTDGETDLLTLSHEFTRNLKLAEMVISTDHPVAGSNITISATILNDGDLAVANLPISFYNGNPSAGGVLIRSAIVSNTLASGFTTTLAITYTVPLTGGAKLLYAVVDPANIFVESNETDNSLLIAAFGPDLEITSATVDYWGGSATGLVTLVRNIGTTTAPTATLAFYRGGITGTLITTNTVTPLSAGQSITMTTPENFGVLGIGSYRLVAIANQVNFTETFKSNNVYTFTLDVLPDLVVSPYYLWTTSPTGTQVVITATVFNFGAFTATNSMVGVYGTDRLIDGPVLFTRTITNLGPSQSTTISGQVSGPLACTAYVLADPYSSLMEVDKENNLAGISYRGKCYMTYLPVVLKNH